MFAKLAGFYCHNRPITNSQVGKETLKVSQVFIVVFENSSMRASVNSCCSFKQTRADSNDR